MSHLYIVLLHQFMSQDLVNMLLNMLNTTICLQEEKLLLHMKYPQGVSQWYSVR